MAIFKERRSEVFTCNIFSKTISLLNDNLREGRRFSIIASNTDMYLVNNNITVDFLNKKCSCNKTLETRFPCSHMCAVLLLLRMNPLTYVDHYFRVTNYLEAYSRPILPLTFINLIKNDSLPPVERRARGDPRNSRFRSASEN